MGRSYSRERSTLAELFSVDKPKREATLMAFAVVPWLDTGQGTRRFFEAMDAARRQLSVADHLEVALTIHDAEELLDAYLAAAVEHECDDYRVAIGAVLSGAAPEDAVRARAGVLSDELATELRVDLGGASVTLPALSSKKGNVWYCLVNETEEPLTSGLGIDAPSPRLPDAVAVEGVEMTLGPVPVYDRKTRTYSDSEFEPFDIKRHVESTVAIGGFEFRLKVRVTVKKRGGWHVTASAVPAEKVPASQIGKTPARRRGSASPSSGDNAVNNAKGAELLNALREIS